MSGMDVDEDGDTFFDDDFPDIAEDELQQLEQNAISFTQRDRARPASTVQPNDSGKYNRTQLPQSVNGAHQSFTTAVSCTESNAERKQVLDVHLDTSDGSVDENGVPLVVEEGPPAVVRKQPDETTLREQWRTNRFGQPSTNVHARRGQSFPQRSNRQYQPPTQFQAYPGVPRSHPPTQQDSFSTIRSAVIDDESLRAKIEELTTDLARAHDELLARKGEIQIIRAKHVEGDKIHNRELDALRKLKQEEAEKHRLAIEALQAERAKTISDVQFMKQELNDESRKVESLKQKLKERPLRDKTTNFESTPKRNANSLRDGFDDADLMVISPARSGRRSNKGTPAANRKRKQPTTSELDIQPLALRPLLGNAENGATYDKVSKSSTSNLVAIRDKATERHLQLLQRVLAFRPAGSRRPITEQLMQMTFPSDSTRSLGSIVLELTSKLKGERLPGDLLQIFIGLWSRALKEKFHVCLRLLLAVTNYILDLDCFVVDAEIISNLLPLVQLSAEVNAKARFRLLVNQDWLDNPDKRKPTFDNAINTTSCLDLLYTVACLSSDEQDLISQFWRSMNTDFVLMMLNACQPVQDVCLMLQLLATSILPTTFGNICTEEEQNRMETYITDRVCYLLWENPKTLEGEKPCTKTASCRLRLQAIDLLTNLSMTSSVNIYDPSMATNHGTVFLANHPTAIARLVRSIYEETAAMYLVTPTQPLHAELVNNAVRVLHFILNSPAGREIDLQRKLAGTNGGAHKHRVVLTRLAFSEGQFIDRGITEETVAMATELLEDSVTPDEAEDLTAAFGGGSGRNTSTQR